MQLGTEGKLAVTTLCYVEKDGKYLMLHRVKKKHDINKDKYIGIGGHVEDGESPLECIKREAKEETGLTLRDPKLSGIISFLIDDLYELTFLYTCSDFTGEVGECSEGTLEWIEKPRVTQLPIWEGDRLMFELLDTRQDVFSLKLTYVKDVLTDAVAD